MACGNGDLGTMPGEVLVAVCGWLDNRDVLSWMSTCQRFRSELSIEMVWRDRLEQTYDPDTMYLFFVAEVVLDPGDGEEFVLTLFYHRLRMYIFAGVKDGSLYDMFQHISRQLWLRSFKGIFNKDFLEMDGVPAFT